MASLSHGPAAYVPERPQVADLLRIPEMWAGLSIITIWLAVLFDAIWGPDFVSHSAGGDTTTIPSVIVVAFFALCATLGVARVAFGRSRG